MCSLENKLASSGGNPMILFQMNLEIQKIGAWMALEIVFWLKGGKFM